MKVYRFLAYTIAVLVMTQAATVAWAFFGMTDWIENDGGVVNKALLESDDSAGFFAEWGFAFHMFFVGLLLIPLVSLSLLITSFFAKVPKGVLWAAGIFGLIVLQVIVLPMLAREVDPGFGALHGLNAIVLFGVAVLAGRRAVPRATAAAPAVGRERSVTA